MSSPLDRSRLTLVRCNAAQTRQSRINHWPQWGKKYGFSLDDWIRRPDLDPSYAWAAGDRYATWALVDRSEAGSLDLLAQCETFRRNCIYLPAGGKGTEPIDTYSYGVSCVYTLPQNRGKGYAKHLMSLLHYALADAAHLPPFPAEWGTAPVIHGFKDGRFSDLYSVLGPTFYASCQQGDGEGSEEGWMLHRLETRTWNVQPTEGQEELGRGWKFLKAEDFRELGATLAAEMRESMSHAGRSAKPRMAILPEEDLFYLNGFRDRLVAEYMSLPGAAERTCGLTAPADDGSPAPFIAYISRPGADGPTLLLNYVRQPFPFDGVLAAARREGCTRIEQWGGDGTWDSESGGATIEVDRNGNLPCLAQYGFGADAVEWVFLDRYSLC